MKPEQEQIKEMMLDVPQTIIAYDANPKGQHLYGEQRLQIAEVLYDKGYGRISEYKAEIERLEAEFKQLQTNAEILAWGVRDLNHENYELTKKVKQAKIDVLNKAKERLDSAPNGWAYTTYIDELIEEVENEQKD